MPFAKTPCPWLVVGFLSALLGATGTSQSAPDFTTDVRPVLSKNCFACHGPDEGHREAGLRLDDRAHALAGGRSGPAITPLNRTESLLFQRITATDTQRMPPAASGHQLNAAEIETLGRWIDAGAPYAAHWSFVAPVRPALPSVRNEAWVKNPVDRFVLAKLEGAGLSPSPPADREAWLRRVHLDVIGLPPSPAARAAFLADQRPDAYERVVDELLASPLFGERWARVWLDIARYADSAGYASDPLRMIWRYRDWVIEALNRNLPFDQFVIEQLAGDLLPSPTPDQVLATAFHRNTMTNTEGGTDDEEFRVVAVKDRANTTAQALMGLTLGCAQCHSHKFDPISQQEYYQFYAFFNQTADNDQPDERPRVATPTADQAEVLKNLEAEIETLNQRLENPGPELAAAQEVFERTALTWPQTFHVLAPKVARSAEGTTLTINVDGSVEASGEVPQNDTYTLVIDGPVADIAALRIEALVNAEGKPGRTSHGNFVLNEVRVRRRKVSPETIQGRTVRISLKGQGRILSLAEVEIWSDGKNIATSGHATQSSTDYDGPPHLAVDGNTSGVFSEMSVTHTRTERDPWWQVRLKNSAAIDRIVVWNRIDGDLESRLAGAMIEVLDDDGGVVFRHTQRDAPRPSVELFPGRDGAPVDLASASATFSQDDFDVAKAIDGDLGPKSGWAISPRQEAAHAAVFRLAKPLSLAKDEHLEIALHQTFGSKHTLARVRVAATTDPEARALPSDVATILAKSPPERTQEERAAVRAHYLTFAPLVAAVRQELASKREALRTLNVARTPVMQELPAARQRETYLMLKGNFLQKGDVVTPGTPASLPPFPENAAKNRLGLAHWIFDPKNPLTARVTANRLWSRVFGVGLVETEEDFGSQGMLPSHPHLLDWLAVELRDGGWNTKALLRTMVLSSTYRQSSVVTDVHRRVDPRNRLLSRAPRFRLEAEIVRDQALALAGLLSKKRGGPSVYPPQPPGLWRAAFNGGDRKWPTSMGEDRWRRGVYTFMRRTAPYPGLTTFDAPSREICTIRRIRTNTPLQAFVTLNDPGFVECAQGLARRIVQEAGLTPSARVRFALDLCLGRAPRDREIAVISELHDTELNHYRAAPTDAVKLVTAEALPPLGAGVEIEDLAAWTVVANVLLNMDAVLTKN